METTEPNASRPHAAGGKSKSAPTAADPEEYEERNIATALVFGPGKFPLGYLVATSGAMATVSTDEMRQSITQHLQGDWGDLCDEDKASNEDALRNRSRLFSAYHTRSGQKYYIITEHDRSITTVLLPCEY